MPPKPKRKYTRKPKTGLAQKAQTQVKTSEKEGSKAEAKQAQQTSVIVKIGDTKPRRRAAPRKPKGTSGFPSRGSAGGGLPPAAPVPSLPPTTVQAPLLTYQPFELKGFPQIKTPEQIGQQQQLKSMFDFTEEDKVRGYKQLQPTVKQSNLDYIRQLFSQSAQSPLSGYGTPSNVMIETVPTTVPQTPKVVPNTMDQRQILQLVDINNGSGFSQAGDISTGLVQPKDILAQQLAPHQPQTAIPSAQVLGLDQFQQLDQQVKPKVVVEDDDEEMIIQPKVDTTSEKKKRADIIAKNKAEADEWIAEYVYSGEYDYDTIEEDLRKLNIKPQLAAIAAQIGADYKTEDKKRYLSKSTIIENILEKAQQYF